MISIQYWLPKQLITEFMGLVGRSKLLSKMVIAIFIKAYNIDLSESVVPEAGYQTFNEFFTRALKPGVRPLANAALVSPADGTLSEFGELKDGKLLQAKGVEYREETLLAGSTGYRSFATVYLAPHNYHHVHAPCDFVVRRVHYVPGTLFSVSLKTAAGIPNLFARNERLIIEGDTPYGKMAYVMVGAMCVAGMETAITGPIPRSKKPQDFYAERAFSKGERIGSFYMGSTVILLTEAKLNMQTKSGEIKLGAALAEVAE